jgi:transcriptional regulator with XRE-family HTH domain
MPLSKVADWFVLADLNALADETDLTQQQIATEIGVSSRTVTNYLTGETRPKAGMASAFAKACGASDKRAAYLAHVIKQLDSGSIVSDLEERNIFIVERAEASYGEIWKWEPWWIPGPIQIQPYHMEKLGDQTKQPMQNWQRKSRRYLTIFNRKPGPTLKFLISENALNQLEDWQWRDLQLEHLLKLDALPNCEIRVFGGLQRGVEHAFDIYRNGGAPNAGPSFTYVETIDQSRHIESPDKIDLYHGLVRGMWSPAWPYRRWFNDRVHRLA